MVILNFRKFNLILFFFAYFSDEIKLIRYLSYVRSILLSFNVFTTRLSIFGSLVVFALVGNVLTARNAFVITAFYNILRHTMTSFFPRGE